MQVFLKNVCRPSTLLLTACISCPQDSHTNTSHGNRQNTQRHLTFNPTGTHTSDKINRGCVLRRKHKDTHRHAQLDRAVFVRGPNYETERGRGRGVTWGEGRASEGVEENDPQKSCH